jgi:hypothetical protein
VHKTFVITPSTRDYRLKARAGGPPDQFRPSGIAPWQALAAQNVLPDNFITSLGENFITCLVGKRWGLSRNDERGYGKLR